MNQVTILGANSAIPAYGRRPSAQFLQFCNHSILIDCGEGTQLTLFELGIKFQKINHIFISHLHGDHLFGLPGLLTTLQLQQRTAPLHVYGPAPIKKYLDVNIYDIGHRLSYDLIVHEIDCENQQTILETTSFTVTSIPLNHRISCSGFLFKEKLKHPKLNKALIEPLDLSVEQIKQILNDPIVTIDQKNIPSRTFHLAPPSLSSYAYCSDTAYSPSIVPIIDQTHTLYHETTYLAEMEQQAKERFHSTTHQAAEIAKQSNVKRLIVGHYSSRYKDITPFQKEAMTIFPTVELAYKGQVFDL